MLTLTGADGNFFKGLGSFLTGGATGKNIGGALKASGIIGDAIIMPGGNIIRTDPKDYIFAAKDPSVIPAMAGASIGGGGGQVVNHYHIQAMDAKSFKRYLRSNPGALASGNRVATDRKFQ
jgi:hypothetical protein